MSADNLMQPLALLRQEKHAQSFFGEPYRVGDKTLVPLVSKTYEGSSVDAAFVKQVAIVMVEGTKVSIMNIPNRLPSLLTVLVLIGWNTYWLLKTFRQWRRQR